MISWILAKIAPVKRSNVTYHAQVRFAERRMKEAKLSARTELRNRLTAACNAAYIGIAKVEPKAGGKWRITYGKDQFVTTMHPVNRNMEGFKLLTCYPSI